MSLLPHKPCAGYTFGKHSFETKNANPAFASNRDCYIVEAFRLIIAHRLVSVCGEASREYWTRFICKPTPTLFELQHQMLTSFASETSSVNLTECVREASFSSQSSLSESRSRMLVSVGTITISFYDSNIADVFLSTF